MLFLYYPPCSTCKKAKNWLDDKGIAYTARHIQESSPSYEELKHWLEISGLPVKKFFNTSGLQYRALGLKEKLPTMTVEEQLQLLATDGMLVKRPVCITDHNQILLGFKENQWAELLLESSK